MPRTASKIVPAMVDKLGPGRHSDGDGLYLLVGPKARYWIFRYVRDKRMREMGLGRAGKNYVPLANARAAARTLRNKLNQGIDPLAEREARKAAETARAEAKGRTFREAAMAFIAAKESGWKNAKHHAQWKATLETYAYPIFGDLPVRKMTTKHVADALAPIWISKMETANRVRSRIEAVLDHELGDDEAWSNPATIRGALERALPTRPKRSAVQHHAALPWEEIGIFMQTLRTRPGLAARALEFCILTAARTAETLGAKWGEIDRQKATWSIPGERMKGGILHRVPLSVAALMVLDEMAKLRATADAAAFVFPGLEPGKSLSNTAMLMTLRRMGKDDVTGHGFRATFRIWAEEHACVAKEVSELALAHIRPDKTERAYARGDLLERRRPLMQHWAEFCAEPYVPPVAASANVLPFRLAAS